MDVRIARSTVGGTAQAPPSKSYTHRAILAAGYGDGGRIRDPLWSDDTRATARAVAAFGGEVAETADGSALDVEGFDGRPGVPADVVDCDNSGTTMRLATAAAALADGLTVLTGDGSLRSRPQGPLLDAVDDLGGRAESTRANGQAPLVVGGPVAGGTVSIPGDVSSQFVTALLMAGAVTDEGIRVELATELKSAPYVEITLEVLDAFGVDARAIGADGSAGNGSDGSGSGSDGSGDGSDGSEGADVEGFAVDGGQRYDPGPDGYRVPGDFSSTSYLLAAGALAAPDRLRVENARPSAQGDAAIVGVLERMGARIDWDREAGRIDVRRSELSGVTVDVGDTPDLLPTIAVLGAVADGETRIENCEHVRYKETDRVRAMAEELDGMGAAVTEREDTLVVHGNRSDLQGTRVDGRGDHRIVMACAVAALVAEGESTIEGAEHVDVSFPGFFEVLERIGADVSR